MEQEGGLEEGASIAYLPKVQELLKQFDIKGDKTIRAQDLAMFLRVLGVNPTEKMLAGYIAQFDPSGENRISFQDCEKIALPLMAGTPPNVQLLQAFRHFDKDGRGKISTAELRYIVTNLGDPLPPDEIEEFLHMADPEGAGDVDYNNFIKLLYPTS